MPSCPETPPWGARWDSDFSPTQPDVSLTEAAALPLGSASPYSWGESRLCPVPSPAPAASQDVPRSPSPLQACAHCTTRPGRAGWSPCGCFCAPLQPSTPPRWTGRSRCIWPPSTDTTKWYVSLPAREGCQSRGLVGGGWPGQTPHSVSSTLVRNAPPASVQPVPGQQGEKDAPGSGLRVWAAQGEGY